jgi:glyoxylate reductase
MACSGKGDNMPQLLITGDIGEPYLVPLIDAGFSLIRPQQHLDQESLAVILRDVDGYLLGGDEVATASVLETAEKLRVISFWGVGYEGFIDMKTCARRGIAVTNTPGMTTVAVAELTVAHALNLVRGVTRHYLDVRAGKSCKHLTDTFSGLRVGIIGLGDIGQAVARILGAGFGCAVSYFSRNRKRAAERALGLRFLSLSALLAQSDIVIVTLAANPETQNFLGKQEFEIMKKGAFLVNTARAGIVDPVALRDALVQGRIIAAAFDGYYQEPLPTPGQDPFGLLSFPDERFVVTPHIAAFTQQSREKITVRAIQSLKNFFDGVDIQDVSRAFVAERA